MPSGDLHRLIDLVFTGCELLQLQPRDQISDARKTQGCPKTSTRSNDDDRAKSSAVHPHADSPFLYISTSAKRRRAGAHITCKHPVYSIRVLSVLWSHDSHRRICRGNQISIVSLVAPTCCLTDRCCEVKVAQCHDVPDSFFIAKVCEFLVGSPFPLWAEPY